MSSNDQMTIGEKKLISPIKVINKSKSKVQSQGPIANPKSKGK